MQHDECSKSFTSRSSSAPIRRDSPHGTTAVKNSVSGRPLKAYWDAQDARVAGGAFGHAVVDALYRRLSATVHANPTVWNESRDGLLVSVAPATAVDREAMLHEATRCVAYVVMHELQDLDVDGLDELFGNQWTHVATVLRI
jgi:hypothetical protein